MGAVVGPFDGLVALALIRIVRLVLNVAAVLILVLRVTVQRVEQGDVGLDPLGNPAAQLAVRIGGVYGRQS